MFRFRVLPFKVQVFRAETSGLLLQAEELGEHMVLFRACSWGSLASRSPDSTIAYEEVKVASEISFGNLHSFWLYRQKSSWPHIGHPKCHRLAAWNLFANQEMPE